MGLGEPLPDDHSAEPDDSWFENTEELEEVVEETTTTTTTRRTYRRRLVTHRVGVHDWDGLERALREKAGDSADELGLDSLRSALDEEEHDHEFGPRVRTWLGGITEKIGSDVIVGLTAETVVTLLRAYLGT
jgi:hypothetical protein